MCIPRTSGQSSFFRFNVWKNIFFFFKSGEHLGKMLVDGME